MTEELKSKIEKLAELQKKIYAFNYASSSIYLDGVTVAPRDTEEGRGEALGILSEYTYELATSKETIELLESLKEHKDELTPHQAREVELLLRDNDYMKNIPQEEYVAYQRILSKADYVWHRAKEENDYESFKPVLKDIFDYNIRFAKYYKPDEEPYNTQLNMFERGLTMEQCDKFFATLREHIVPLIKKIGEVPQIDDSPLYGDFPIVKQKELTKYLMDYMGIDPNHCVCGETEHPFTLEFTKDDVRITTHYFEDNVTSSMYSVIHESGHALYELGGADEHKYTVVAGGVSMGIHESQSRFFENIIGRSEAFTGAILPKFKEMFPEQFADITPRSFYEMINKAQPSLIRTEADELTYALHIMVRYEIEKKMFAGELTVDEIPAEWNRLYKEYLGVDVPNDTKGCLQDSHWSGGSIGYFPSYALGSAYGAQMLAKMREDMDVEAVCASGTLKPISDWLTERIYQYASMYDPKELFEKVCGAPFDPTYYTDYLEKKYSDIYKL
ncbi:MAG: carboxypeptidase M32 [Oscillospiraceae bacterium]